MAARRLASNTVFQTITLANLTAALRDLREAGLKLPPETTDFGVPPDRRVYRNPSATRWTTPSARWMRPRTARNRACMAARRLASNRDLREAGLKLPPETTDFGVPPDRRVYRSRDFH
jgi:hypothetical protein